MKKASLFFILILGFGLVLSKPVLAQYQLENFAGSAGYKTGDSETVENKVQLVINGGLSVIAIIFLVLCLYAGIRWMTARGQEEEITKARETLIAATIGLAVVAGAYAITNFAFSRLNQNAAVPENITNGTGEENTTEDNAGEATVGGSSLNNCGENLVGLCLNNPDWLKNQAKYDLIPGLCPSSDELCYKLLK